MFGESNSIHSRGFREKDVTNLSKALVLCEISLGICFGWWGGREFEGKSRGVLTLVLLLAGFARIFLARLAKRFGGPSVSGMERWACFLFAVAIGLIAFKYDIERRAPWSQAVFDLHLASQKLLPIIISWLISTSVVLAYLSNSPEKNSRNE